MKSLFLGLAFLLSYVGFGYADTQTEPEGDFVRGLKTGSASALIPGFGQTYVALALLGARFDKLGISVKDADKIRKWQSFASGILIGHAAVLSFYMTTILMTAKYFGLPYAVVATVLGPVSLTLLVRHLTDTVENSDIIVHIN